MWGARPQEDFWPVDKKRCLNQAKGLMCDPAQPGVHLPLGQWAEGLEDSECGELPVVLPLESAGGLCIFKLSPVASPPGSFPSLGG